MRVAIVTESFLPQVNGVTNSVLRVVEHLHGRGHDALVVAPGISGPGSYRHAAVTRVRAVDLPVISSLPIGMPSPKVHADLTAHGVPRVHRWARGVDTELFSPWQADPRLRARLAPHDELLVGYVGRLAPEKHVRRLAALDAVPGVRVVVVGAGPEEPALRKALPGAVFLGFRTGHELAAAYASLDVFVHTGPHETFCQAVQEALASGVPVIAPDAGGPRDLVEHGRTGFLIEPHDDEAFAATLVSTVELLRHRALRRRLGAAARESVLARTWPAVCDELIGHYDQVSTAILAA